MDPRSPNNDLSCDTSRSSTATCRYPSRCPFLAMRSCSSNRVKLAEAYPLHLGLLVHDDGVDPLLGPFGSGRTSFDEQHAQLRDGPVLPERWGPQATASRSPAPVLLQPLLPTLRRAPRPTRLEHLPTAAGVPDLHPIGRPAKRAFT